MHNARLDYGKMKAIVIGLDGATWDILDSMIKSEHLPNLKLLIKKGTRGKLESTVPPVTGCAWLSLATSLNPGKTGVIDFLNTDNKLNLKPVSSSDFRARSFWDLLSKAGKECVVLDYPMLHPAYPINGAIISTWIGRLNTFPKRLEKEIRKIVGDYDIFVGYNEEKYNDIDLFLHHLNDALEKKIKVTRYLLDNVNWDLFINVISFTDWIQHRMWHYVDENHPWYDESESSKILPRFIQFWKKIDSLLGEMIPYADYLFIVSDHGMGPQYGCFNIAKWLEMEGYMKRRFFLKHLFKQSISVVPRSWLSRILPEKIKEKGRSYTSILSEIDMKNSDVFVVGHSIPFGAIYINSKDRNSKRIVNKCKEYETLKRDLIISLKNLKDDFKQNVEATVFKREEIYLGSKVQVLPDIIFTVNNWSCVVIKDLNANFLYKNAPYSKRHTGSHRLDGVFLAYGPSIKGGFETDVAKIYDITPTILHLFDVPIPKDVDGRVLKEIFKENSNLRPQIKCF